MSPLDYGWTNKWGACTDKYFMGRVLSDPEDFRLAHDIFGADVMSRDHFCLNPGDLPQILAEHSGITDIETLFDPSEVAKEVERLALAREGRSQKDCPFCGEQVLAHAKKCKHCGEFLGGTNRQTNKTTVIAKEGVFLKTLNFGCVLIFAAIITIIVVIVYVLQNFK
jgi:hypothetical protein